MRSQECPVCIQGLNQRADVVVYGKEAQPLLLAECKAPEITIAATVYAQAVRYNTALGARYLLLTNGLRHYIYEHDGNGGYAPLTGFDQLEL